MSIGGWALGRSPALDGIRGFAIALVVICHTLNFELGRDTYRGLGSTGVAMFFALSGYLITGLFCEDSNLVRFYRNRAVRLLPALFLMLAGFWLLEIYLATPLMAGVRWVLIYVGNWNQIAGAHVGVLAPTWSLAVEEQFYLVWPLLLLATRRWPRAQIGLAIALLLASTAERLLLFSHASDARVYSGSDTASGALLVGCLLALAMRHGLPEIRMPRRVLFGSTAALTALACVPTALSFVVVMPTVASAWGAVLIWARAPFTWAWLRYLGRRSYALYLWHAGLIWMAVQIGGRSWLTTAVAVALAIGVAEASWRLVELPARALRDSGTRHAGERRRVEATPVGSPASSRTPCSAGPRSPSWPLEAGPVFNERYGRSASCPLSRSTRAIVDTTVPPSRDLLG